MEFLGSGLTTFYLGYTFFFTILVTLGISSSEDDSGVAARFLFFGVKDAARAGGRFGGRGVALTVLGFELFLSLLTREKDDSELLYVVSSFSSITCSSNKGIPSSYFF